MTGNSACSTGTNAWKTGPASCAKTSRGRISASVTHRLKDVKYGVRLKPLFDGGPPIIFSHHLHKHLIPVELPDGTYRRQQCFASSITLGELGQTMAIITLQDVTEAYHRIKEIEQLRDEVMLELALRKRTEATLREK